MVDYSRICFVIMPFGTKRVGERDVDFDSIYDDIIEPAVNATPLPDPEEGHLEAHRTDRDFFTGDISHEMFNYIEYSRFAFADITGLNANVFYELGHRHRAAEAGTAIFRQVDAPIPFDIGHIKAFMYEPSPVDKAAEARQLITRVLRESLAQNRPDSPVRLALVGQRQRGGDPETHIREAENAIRHQDAATALAKYLLALQDDRENPVLRVRIGLLYKARGQWNEAFEHFAAAACLAPDYAEALREMGIAMNKLDGETQLRRAIELNPGDFDAMASLGGVLKRKGRLDEAHALYERAAEVSQGHSYPLLNAIELKAALESRLDLDPSTVSRLQRAKRAREAQTRHEPPYDVPWSFFDLAEIRLFLGDGPGFLDALDSGLATCDASWQAESFRDSLVSLQNWKADLEGLEAGIQQLDQAIRELP